MQAELVASAHVLYAVLAFVCAVVMLILLNRTLSVKNETATKRTYIRLLIMAIVFCATDGFWGLCASLLIESRFWFYIASYGFHSMSAIAAFIWVLYARSYLGEKMPKTKATRILRHVINVLAVCLLTAQIAILVSNPFPPAEQVFTIVKGTLEYKPDYLRQWLFYLQFSNYVAMLICSVLCFLSARSDKEKKAYFSTAIVFSAVPLITGIFQKIYPDMPVYSLGFMLSCLCIYVFTVSHDQQRYIAQSETLKLRSEYDERKDRDFAIINSLSSKYEYIGVIDAEHNTITNYRANGIFAPYFLVDDTITRPDEFDKVLRSFIPKDELADFLSKVERKRATELLKNGELPYADFRAVTDGEIQDFRVSFYLIPGSHSLVIIAFQNIDEEIAKRRELAEAKAKAEEANRAKTAFLFNMSHDIRTPMNAIIGFNNMSRKYIDDKEKLTNCIDKVGMASEHLLTLINDVLDMSRIEYGKVKLEEKPYDIKKAVTDFSDMFTKTAEDAKVTLQNDISGIVHQNVIGDELRAGRIYINIVSNAIKYTPAGGTVTAKLSEHECEREGYATYRIEVRDNGIGMSPEFLEHIYDSFARENTSTVSGIQGTGLGMAITKQFVEMMGGTIDIKSAKGVGTTVTVDLPLKLADAEGTAEAKAEANAESVKGMRLLVAEDNELNREILVDILTEMGIEADCAEDGTVAVEKVKAGGLDRYDAVLMDVQMPKMNGYEATAKIRELDVGGTLPIFAVTANAFEEDRRAALAAGMNGHVSKPIKPDELTAVLCSVKKKNS